MSFKEIVKKYGIKNEATSNIKIKELLKELDFHESCGIYMRDDKFTTMAGIVNLHPTKGTHWVMFINEYFFDSYGCPQPLNIMSFINNGFIQIIKLRKKIVIVQRIVYWFRISQILLASKMQY